VLTGMAAIQRRRPTRSTSHSPRVARSLLAVLAVLGTIAALGALSGGYIFTRTTPVALVFAGVVVAGVWLVIPAIGCEVMSAVPVLMKS